MDNHRSTWTSLTESQLLSQCEVDTYRASGPGGQKRNKTSSAVRLRHLPSGLIVIAEESRSQHENKAKALKRMWQAFFLHLREPLTAEQLAPAYLQSHPELAPAIVEGRLHLSARDQRFWPAVGVVLDILAAVGGQVSTAAELLGLNTANLVDFLQTHEKPWQEANQIRLAHGHKPLKSG